MTKFILAIHLFTDLGRFIQEGKGYIKTELHRDISNPDRFITVDYWHTKADRDKFRIEFAEDFKTLDDFCEGFTDKENFLGDFESHVADG